MDKTAIGGEGRMKEKDVCLRCFHYAQEDAKAAQEELEELFGDRETEA